MIVIDSEFEAICPTLTDDEFSGLEASIIKEGCRDAIVLLSPLGDDLIDFSEKTEECRSRYRILDGHNRYNICLNHGIKFSHQILSLESRGDAINWIINNQLNRRNVTPNQAAFLRGKRYEQEKKTQGGTGANQYEQSNQNDTSATREILAKELGVSPATIQRDAKYAEAVDTIGARLGEPVKQKILQGKTNLNKQATIAIAESLPEVKQVELKTETVRGVPLNEYAIETEDGEILFNRKKIAQLIAETKRNPGISAEWSRLMKAISGFKVTYPIDEIVSMVANDASDYKSALWCLDFFEEIIAKVDAKGVFTDEN